MHAVAGKEENMFRRLGWSGFDQKCQRVWAKSGQAEHMVPWRCAG